jgi:trehalose-6-phosphate synthase
MRFSVRFILMLIPVLFAVVLGFIRVLDKLERQWVNSDLSQQSRALRHQLEDAIEGSRPELIQKIVARISRDSRVLGILVCSPEEKTWARSFAIPKSVDCRGIQALSLQPPAFLETEGVTLHRSAYPLSDENSQVHGYVLILQNASYFMAQQGMLTRKYFLLAFLTLVFLVAVVTMVLHRWSASRRAEQFSVALKGLLKGDISKLSAVFEHPEFRPLVKHLDRVLFELGRKKVTKNNEEILFVTADKLTDEVRRMFGDSQICVIANREPYVHNRKGKKIETVFPASGLVTAVEPIVRACSGLWIGHGSGTADRETADKRGVILVPPGNPEYALKRVWLSRNEEQGYYNGFANEGLWPLCHIAHTRPIFRAEDWENYSRVNEKFADAFGEEMKGPSPIALIQDYHFALLPGILRKRRPDAVTSLFWHIPWPNPEAIRICPWKTELLRGMLGADVIGFHIQHHCNNFLDTVDSFLEARVDRESFSVTMKGHTCYVRPFPISIEWPPKHDIAADQIPQVRAQLLEELLIPQDALVGVGVDRMDYTKGITERLLAVERLLEKHPQLVGKFFFVQISAPSRTQIKRYQELDIEVRELALRINSRFHKPGYEPIQLRTHHHDSEEVFRFYRAADVCVVTALHDGMNLVAKEFIASRSDSGGSLVISSFTGAARELKDAFIVNPYNIEETADAIYKGLTVSPEERSQRMTRMRSLVSTYNVYDWAVKFLMEIHKISERKQAATGTA